MTRNELSTIIGEVLKDWWYLDSTMGETQERLTARLEGLLTPVQSGGVVTREEIAARLKEISEQASEQGYPFKGDWFSWYAERLYALQLLQPSSIEQAVKALEEADIWLWGDTKADQDNKERRFHGHALVRQALATLRAMTPQPEALGVDFSGVKRWHMDGENFREVQDPLGDWIRFDDLAHLQQAPQGVGNKEAGSDTTKAD